MTTTVILPDGETFITAAPTPLTTATHEHEEHAAATHTEHDDLSVPNVMVVDYDAAFDTNDSNIARDVITQLDFGALPTIIDDRRFVVDSPLNDVDVTRDHSAIRIYRNVFIQPPPSKAVGYPSPTLYTSGSIALVGDSAIGYVPYSGNGQQRPNTKYAFGRVGVLGDRSGDNDGMLMQKDVGNVFHSVHIAPDPTDPNILIRSTKFRPDGEVVGVSYIKCVNVGPNITAQNGNTVFEVTDSGYIKSTQLTQLSNSIAGNELMIRQANSNMSMQEDQITGFQTQIADLAARVAALEN